MKKITALLLSFVFILGLPLSAQTDQQPLTVKLWEGNPPDFVPGAGPETVSSGTDAANVNIPSMIVHLPKPQANPSLALVVCPGGSYRVVGSVQDGMRAVPFFVPRGVAVIVLKYRTSPPADVHVVTADALEDGKRAIRLVRLHAKEWNIDPNRVGMLGGSAGSHLIVNLATHCDKGTPGAPDPVDQQSCRPDFAVILCPYPNHQPLSDFPITKDTPPIFAASAVDDVVAPTEFARGLIDACHAAGVTADLWTVPDGGHRAFDQVANPAYKWPERTVAWLRKIGVWKNAGN